MNLPYEAEVSITFNRHLPIITPDMEVWDEHNRLVGVVTKTKARNGSLVITVHLDSPPTGELYSIGKPCRCPDRPHGWHREGP